MIGHVSKCHSFINSFINSLIHSLGFNILMNKPSIQVNTYNSQVGSYANDGDISTSSMATYYWQGDLGAFYDVTSVRVTSPINQGKNTNFSLSITHLFTHSLIHTPHRSGTCSGHFAIIYSHSPSLKHNS